MDLLLSRQDFHTNLLLPGVWFASLLHNLETELLVSFMLSNIGTACQGRDGITSPGSAQKTCGCDTQGLVLGVGLAVLMVGFDDCRVFSSPSDSVILYRLCLMGSLCLRVLAAEENYLRGVQDVSNI